jgi:putative phage-type endonuclease
MSEQGTDDWFQSRLGKVTASRMSCILAKPKNESNGGVRQSYMNQLIQERLTGKRNAGFQTASMQWGSDNEPLARDAYCRFRGVSVEEVGFIDHPSIPWSGASPDGLVGNDGLVEIKCPNTKNHLAVIKSDKIPSRYYYQIMWQLAVTGRKWCDFVTYDPRLDNPRRIFVKRVLRDTDTIEYIENAVIDFTHHVELNLLKKSDLESQKISLPKKRLYLARQKRIAANLRKINNSDFDFYYLQMEQMYRDMIFKLPIREYDISEIRSQETIEFVIEIYEQIIDDEFEFTISQREVLGIQFRKKSEFVIAIYEKIQVDEADKCFIISRLFKDIGSVLSTGVNFGLLNW